MFSIYFCDWLLEGEKEIQIGMLAFPTQLLSRQIAETKAKFYKLNLNKKNDENISDSHKKVNQ